MLRNILLHYPAIISCWVVLDWISLHVLWTHTTLIEWMHNGQVRAFSLWAGHSGASTSSPSVAHFTHPIYTLCCGKVGQTTGHTYSTKTHARHSSKHCSDWAACEGPPACTPSAQHVALPTPRNPSLHTLVSVTGRSSQTKHLRRFYGSQQRNATACSSSMQEPGPCLIHVQSPALTLRGLPLSLYTPKPSSSSIAPHPWRQKGSL